MVRTTWKKSLGVVKHLEQHVKTIVKRLRNESPQLHDLRIVLVGAYQYPDSKGDLVYGEFAPPCPGSPTPVLYICVFSVGERLARITDTICHEWGHYEQFRDNKPIDEGPDIEARTKRLMEAVRG